MCLYPKLIKNPKYKPNKKNNYNPPKLTDPRVGWVPVGCNKCMECMKQRGRQWSVRLQEEIRAHERKGKHMITLTLSNESIRELDKEVEGEITGYERDNEIVTIAVRRFLERWRKKHKKSIRHWLVTELGHNGTENIHLHGILFTEKPEEVAEMWKYGYVWNGTYVNERTVNYIIKYCTKLDAKHKYYKPRILTSSGIGSRYVGTENARINKYSKGKTDETYKTRQGTKLNLPIYYRNKIYTEQERERLWIEKLDKQERWVDGTRVSIKHNDHKAYEAALKMARRKNNSLGYGTDEKDWDREQYENTRRNLQRQIRTGDMEPQSHSNMATRREGTPNKQLEDIGKWLTKVAQRPKRTWADLPEKRKWISGNGET